MQTTNLLYLSECSVNGRISDGGAHEHTTYKAQYH